MTAVSTTTVLRPPPSGTLSQPSAMCAHCGKPSGAGAIGAFCCHGCQAVSRALHASGLDRYYALRGPTGEPIGEGSQGELDTAFVEQLERDLAARSKPHRIALSLQGARCAACVWVLEQLFARLPGALRIDVNIVRGSLELWVEPTFAVGQYIKAIAGVGYRVGPRTEGARAGHDELLLRLGICVALALNAMAFSAALHLGVEAGPLRELLHDLSFIAAVLSVLVGGPVFFGSALRSLRAGVLHLDLPIAVGIGLTATAAAWSYFGGHSEAAYFDSLAAFIALMLAGRYVQERAVLRNRAALLDDPGIGNLQCRRERGGALETTRCATLAADDMLLIPPGELVPVAADLMGESANCSLAWIDGESEPRPFVRGDRLPAGAINVSDRALRLRAAEPFASSELLALLRPTAAEHPATKHLSRFAGFYVIAVLVLAALGFAVHALVYADIARGLAVATAICVVTCPCALGIAIPLAYELAHVALRRRGIFVRSASFLDRARDVRQIVFDKTGTLTTGRLSVANGAALEGLSHDEQAALYQLVARSIHPKSLAIRAALERFEPRYRAEIEVTEQAGQGLSASFDGHEYRLGHAAFAAPGSAGANDTLFSVDGAVCMAIETAETFRADAQDEIRALRASGYRVAILSGDAPQRVAASAARLGVEAERALGGCSPAHKAAWIAANRPEQTLMVGDGINDALAMQAAHCGATPAIDRPFLPARTDFYFTTPGLLAIGTALQAARDVRAMVASNVGFAIAYNAVVVSLALVGEMKPWLAAIVMPLSSVVVVIRTTAVMLRRSRAWKS
jgi:Cu2+-exporting ATPase